MNRLIFQKVESLFEAAANVDASSRTDFLERIEREHSREVRDLLERLLERDRSQTRWLQTGAAAAPALSRPPAARAPGTVIGRFRLIERLGFGGHGEVYLAEQREPVQRRVALKMVRLGAAPNEAVARFRAEQQALALMSHPNIAAVHEAGLADEGVMYFAMEYVQGEPIDVYCDRRRLKVRQRLAVFLDVCNAVQHAHQKGLIHRDLKPSNILVAERNGRPVPVLIDFGIALATGAAEQISAFQHTAGERAVGTPAYMSPEQAGATPNDVDTRADIYALGVVLYELLAGRTPLDVIAPEGASLAQIRVCIMNGAAPSPAALLASDAQAADLAARSRGGSVKALQREIRGDLNAIVSHATAHDRAHRYQTVEALVQDVQNHLEHRFVTVETGSTLGRARKFVRRHRVMVGAATAIMLALAIGVVSTTLAMLRAERSADRSLAMNSFLRDLLTSSRPLEKGASVSFAEVLEGGSAMAGDRFADFPEQEGEIRYLIGQTYYSLGLLHEARVQLEQAVTLLRTSIGVNDTRTLHAMTLLAMTFLDQNRLNQAESLANEIVAVSSGRPMPYREHFLSAERILSCVVGGRGEYRMATARLRALIPQIDTELGQDHLTAYSARMALSQALRRQAADEREKGPTQQYKAEEEAILRETVRIQQERFGVEDAYPVLASQMKLTEVLVETRQFAEAQQIVEAVAPRVKARFGTSHWMFGAAMMTLASVKSAQGDFTGAAQAFDEAVKAWQAMHSPSHPIVLGAKRDFLSYLDDAGRIDEGLQIAQELNQSLSADLGGHGLLALEIQAWIARFASRKGMMEEADRIYASFEPHAEELVNDSVGRIIMLFHAGHLARQGRFEEAEAELIELSRRQQGVASGVNTAHPDDIAQMFVEVYEAWGRDDKVREYQDLAAAIREGRAIDVDSD